MNQNQKTVLETISNKASLANRNVLKNTCFICLQHCLLTAIPFFDHLFKIGGQPKNVFLLGKHYSNSPIASQAFRKLGIHYFEAAPLTTVGKFHQEFSVAIGLFLEEALQHIKKNKIKRVILLEDGGRLIQAISKLDIQELDIIGVEQTSKGIDQISKLDIQWFPVINVAKSAVKKYLESPFIAETIIEKLDEIVKPDSNVGVIGLGSLGMQLSSYLKKYSNNCYVTDVKTESSALFAPQCWCATKAELFEKADIIFGCTGQDVTKDIKDVSIFTGEKIFISCSSEDLEFQTLIRLIASTQNKISDPLADIYYENTNTTITIKKGGFPINFDQSGISVPFSEIQLTRALMLAAVMQASEYFLTQEDIPLSFVALDSKLQFDIATDWAELKKATSLCLDNDFIKKHSEGAPIPISIVKAPQELTLTA